MVQQKINIDNHIWEINLSMTKELEFYYLTEVEKTTHPLWHDWDDDPDEGDPNKRVL